MAAAFVTLAVVSVSIMATLAKEIAMLGIKISDGQHIRQFVVGYQYLVTFGKIL